ncbi:hypothetical protein ACH5RR_023090 [Cinchona calisaya]|uniref:FRIGIDA-like protein n=1 Tax=Cinchona calisaya TaxID=153742 RepID=A0ABD2ZAQ3_9GENT
MQKFHASKRMGLLEEISANLEFAEAKKDSLRKSILMLMVDWRDFEKHQGTTNKCLIECLDELESREKHLNSVQESVSQSSMELRLMEKSVDQKAKEVEDKEKGLICLQEKRMMELELKEKEWALKKEEVIEEFRKREMELGEEEKAVKGLIGKLEMEKNEILGMEKLVEERLREVWLKEESFEERGREIEKRVSELDHRERKIKEREKRVNFSQFGPMAVEREREIEMKEKEVSIMREDLEFKEKDLEFERVVNEKREKELDIREKQLETKKKEYEITQECFEEVHMKEKQCLLEKELLDKGNKELEKKRKEFEDTVKGVKELKMTKKQLERKKKELEMMESQLETKKKELEVTQECLKELRLAKSECHLEKELLEKGNRELELKKKELEDRITEFDLREKELELKEEKLNDKLRACVKRELEEKVMDDRAISNPSSPLFIFSVEFDGLDLHMFLNGHEMNLDSADEVFKDLQSSGDPAYLVLNAMETLNPSYLRKVGMEFGGRVAESCILLLEQLIRISPKIQSCVRTEALKLAQEWKEMIKAGNSLDVLGFLHLLASFDLASAFDMEEVMNFLDSVAQHQKTPELCRRLGVTDKMPGFIFGLTKKMLLLLAVEYVYEFNLVDKIPPVALLKKHVLHSRLVANEICNDGQSTSEAQDKAMMNEICDLKSVIKCIMDHGLQSEYSPDQLRERVVLLERRRAHLKTIMPAPSSKELPKFDANNELPVAWLKQESTKKRSHPDGAFVNEARLPPSNKSRRFAPPAEASQNGQVANCQHFHSNSVQPFSQRPGPKRYGPDVGAPPKHYRGRSFTALIHSRNHNRWRKH